MTNPFYSSEQTELSRAVLGEIVAAVPGAILIGSARPLHQQRVLVGKAFEFLVAEPSLSRAGRDRLRRMGAAWRGSIGIEAQHPGPDPGAGSPMGP